MPRQEIRPDLLSLSQPGSPFLREIWYIEKQGAEQVSCPCRKTLGCSCQEGLGRGLGSRLC